MFSLKGWCPYHPDWSQRGAVVVGLVKGL